MEKFFLKSKTVWGIIILAFPQVLALLGVPWNPESTEELNAIVLLILNHGQETATGIGALLAFWGRVTAKKAITVRTAGSLNAAWPATLLAILLLAGCAQSEVQRWATMQTGYNSTVEAMTSGARTGLLKLEDAEVVEGVRGLARTYLDRSYDCIILTPGSCGASLDSAADALESLSTYLGGS